MNEMILRLAMAVNMLQGAYPVLDEELLEQRQFLAVAAPFVCQLNDSERNFFTAIYGVNSLRGQLRHSRLLVQVINAGPQAGELAAFGSHHDITMAIENNRSYAEVLEKEMHARGRIPWIQKAHDENELLFKKLNLLIAAHIGSEQPRFVRQCLLDLRESVGDKAYYSRQPIPAVPVWSLQKLGERP